MPGGQRQALPAVLPVVGEAAVGSWAVGQPPDFRLLFESLPEKYLVLDRTLVIVAASDAYLVATLTERLGHGGPAPVRRLSRQPRRSATEGARNLKASLTRVLREGTRDSMSVQKYDIPRFAAAGGGFEERSTCTRRLMENGASNWPAPSGPISSSAIS